MTDFTANKAKRHILYNKITNFTLFMFSSVLGIQILNITYVLITEQLFLLFYHCSPIFVHDIVAKHVDSCIYVDADILLLKMMHHSLDE